MDTSRRQVWVRTSVALGFGYALVGILFALPASHMQAWRLAAWVVCALGFAAHIWFEQLRLRNAPGTAALHVALAVALGGFGVAVAANVHSLSVDPASPHRQLLLLSLGIWPVITALPAFLVALGISFVLARAFGSGRSN